jgi:hypothetical protein
LYEGNEREDEKKSWNGLQQSKRCGRRRSGGERDATLERYQTPSLGECWNGRSGRQQRKKAQRSHEPNESGQRVKVKIPARVDTKHVKEEKFETS